MIYDLPNVTDSVDQGDLILDCPVVRVKDLDPDVSALDQYDLTRQPVLVLTQTCDLSQRKTTDVVVARIFDAQDLVVKQVLKAADIRGPLRAGRVWGYYFLPADATLALNEMIIDLRRLTTVRLDVMANLCRAGQRRARLRPLYREHLARHFAETYARIGLPRPLETM